MDILSCCTTTNGDPTRYHPYKVFQNEKVRVERRRTLKSLPSLFFQQIMYPPCSNEGEPTFDFRGLKTV